MLSIFKNIFSKESADIQTLIKEGATIVDVRTPAEFAQGNATGSVNIPLDQLNARLGELKGKKGIVLCCRSGARAGQAKDLLERNGIENVHNAGAWQSANFPK